MRSVVRRNRFLLRIASACIRIVFPFPRACFGSHLFSRSKIATHSFSLEFLSRVCCKYHRKLSFPNFCIKYRNFMGKWGKNFGDLWATKFTLRKKLILSLSCLFSALVSLRTPIFFEISFLVCLICLDRFLGALLSSLNLFLWSWIRRSLSLISSSSCF